MKNKIIAFAIPLGLIYSCKYSSSTSTTHLGTTDTGKEFIVFAEYEKSKVAVVEEYLDSAFRTKISLKEEASFPVEITNGENATINCSSGHIVITYNKKSGNLKGMAAMKKLKNDLQKRLYP